MAATVQQRSSAPPAPNTGSGRLLSLDVFRGLTILAMVLVNNQGGGTGYWPMEHAEWHGWTPTDLIFPFFLFIVGTSLSYSLRKYRDGARIAPSVYWRIVRRTALLIFLGWMPGLLLRTISYFKHTADTIHLDTLRLPGVLVRIAIVYFFTSILVLHLRLRNQIILGAALLLGYWGLMAFLPDPYDYWGNFSHNTNVAGVIDRAVIGPKHMYSEDRITDPEGLLSTLPSIVTALLGYWTGLFIQRRGINYELVVLLFGCGAICVEIGLLWNLAFPINKKLWTSSYVLLAGGLAMQLLSVCMLMFDIWGWRRLARPFEIVGINAIFVFVASGLTALFVLGANVGKQTIHGWLYHTLFTSWIHDTKLASLGFALMIVTFWWFVCWLMSRLGWAIRV